MIIKFKVFLEEKFKKISPSAKAIRYREKILTKLLKTEKKLRKKGIKNESEIFNLSIKSLGNFDEKISKFELHRLEKEKNISKMKKWSILILSYVLLTTIIYLVTSFTTNAWSKTWLIFVGLIFFAISMVSLAKNDKALIQSNYKGMRISLAVIIILLSVFIFLMLQIIFNVSYSWMTFLVMVMVVTFLDTMLALISKSKYFIIELLICFLVIASLIYVMLGILGTISWHPYWLIPAITALVDMIIGLIIIFCKMIKEDKSKNRI